MPRALTVLAVLAALAGAGGAHAQGPSALDAKAFVTRLYAGYRLSEGPAVLGNRAPGLFTADLVAAIRKDAGSVLDFDPICACTDFDIDHVAVALADTTPTATRATVDFDNGGTHETVRLDLVAVGDSWRIADVHSERAPSLAALLADKPAAR